jgi:hypothetical protein
VISRYHALWNVEKASACQNPTCGPRPVYHCKRDSIEAHLTIVFAALAVTRLIEDRTGRSIKKFVRAARRYRTVQIRAGHHTRTDEDPLPPRSPRRTRPHQVGKRGAHWALHLTAVPGEPG